VVISTVSDSSSGIDTVVSLYDEGGKRLAWEDGYAGGTISGRDTMLYAFFPEDGTYYIKVEDVGTFYDSSEYEPFGSPNASYELTVEDWGSGGDEPDSIFETGVGWSIDDAGIVYPIPFYFPEGDEQDYCLLELPFSDAPLYLFTMQHDEGSDATPFLELFNSEGEPVLMATDPARDAGIQHIQPLGDSYVLKVSEQEGKTGNSYWGYAFVIMGSEGDGNPREEEPNSTMEEAQSIELEDREPDTGTYLGAFAQGFIETAEDQDLYAFTIEEELYITAAFGAQLYGSYLIGRLEVLDSTGEVVGGQDSSPGSDEAMLNVGPLPAGDYFFRVSQVPDSGVGGEGYFYRFGLYASSFELN
jgi:hypothetical protein